MASTTTAAADAIACDICVLGAGPGGLAVATAAAAFGQSVVLVEKHKIGGNSLHYGGVPLRALIAAGRRAEAMRTAAPFGVATAEPQVDFQGVRAHIQRTVATLQRNASVERLTGLGVRVIPAAGRFVDRQTVIAGEQRIAARRFVIATGSAPVIPAIPGLENVPYFTSETIFEHAAPMAHLIVIGADPEGLALAQAYRRLGARVTVLDGGRALSRDDPEMTAILLEVLVQEGLDIRENVAIARVDGGIDAVRVTLATANGGETIVEGSHLLVMEGRKPNIADLGLDAAGVKVEKGAVSVNAGLLTSNARVFAIGDATGGVPLAHLAEHHANVVVRRALLRLPTKASGWAAPSVTFTEPALAHVGLTEERARAGRGRVNALRWPLHENARAQAERMTVGHIKVVTDRHGHVLGATIVGPEAGELIQVWCLAVSQELKIKAMTEWIAPSATFGEINRRVADGLFAGTAANPLIRRAISYLKKLG